MFSQNAILIFIFGLAAGSFINSIVIRFNTGEKVTKGRSRCFNCGNALSWVELIPVFSFMYQSGRCKNCKSKISWQYPAGELLAGLLYLAVFIKWFYSYQDNFGVLLYWLLVTSILMAVSIYDVRHKIIPDAFSYAFLAIAIIGNLFLFKINLMDLILSLTPALFLFALWLVSRGRWMGLGDSKLMLGAGVFLGFPGSLYAIFIAFWAGAILGSSLLLLSPKVTLKSEIPFGPFIVFGILSAFFFSNYLVYFNSFYGW